MHDAFLIGSATLMEDFHQSNSIVKCGTIFLERIFFFAKNVFNFHKTFFMKTLRVIFNEIHISTNRMFLKRTKIAENNFQSLLC